MPAPATSEHLPAPVLPRVFWSEKCPVLSWGTEVERGHGQAPARARGWVERSCILPQFSCRIGPCKTKEMWDEPLCSSRDLPVRLLALSWGRCLSS